MRIMKFHISLKNKSMNIILQLIILGLKRNYKYD